VSRILADGVRYEVRTGGTGPAILLLHGFAGRGADFGPFLAELRRIATTVVVDLLGHGRSDAPADPTRHAVERQAVDLAAILDRLDLAPAAVVGYSFGARVALTLAVEHPAAVRSLLLESPSAGIPDDGERAERRLADEALAASIERDGIEAFVDRWWETAPVFASERGLPVATRTRLRADRLRNRPAALAVSLRGAGQGAMRPLHDRLGTIRVPTTVVAGSLDPIGVERASAVARAIPAARLVVVEGVGHAAHREDPRRFQSILHEAPVAPATDRSPT
jgi:2-succinyl-6-hydroxy-2,4-cyclohexadiene-1-carboxylate synthase